MEQDQELATKQKQRLERIIASSQKDLHKKNEELDQLMKEVLVVDGDLGGSVSDSPSTLSLEGERILLVGGSPDKVERILNQ